MSYHKRRTKQQQLSNKMMGPPRMSSKNKRINAELDPEQLQTLHSDHPEHHPYKACKVKDKRCKSKHLNNSNPPNNDNNQMMQTHRTITRAIRNIMRQQHQQQQPLASHPSPRAFNHLPLTCSCRITSSSSSQKPALQLLSSPLLLSALTLMLVLSVAFSSRLPASFTLPEVAAVSSHISSSENNGASNHRRSQHLLYSDSLDSTGSGFGGSESNEHTKQKQQQRLKKLIAETSTTRREHPISTNHHHHHHHHRRHANVVEATRQQPPSGIDQQHQTSRDPVQNIRHGRSRRNRRYYPIYDNFEPGHLGEAGITAQETTKKHTLMKVPSRRSFSDHENNNNIKWRDTYLHRGRGFKTPDRKLHDFLGRNAYFWNDMHLVDHDRLYGDQLDDGDSVDLYGLDDDDDDDDDDRSDLDVGADLDIDDDDDEDDDGGRDDADDGIEDGSDEDVEMSSPDRNQDNSIIQHGDSLERHSHQPFNRYRLPMNSHLPKATRSRQAKLDHHFYDDKQGEGSNPSQSRPREHKDHQYSPRGRAKQQQGKVSPNVPYQSPVVVSISDNSFVSASPPVNMNQHNHHHHNGDVFNYDDNDNNEQYNNPRILDMNITTSTTATTTSMDDRIDSTSYITAAHNRVETDKISSLNNNISDQDSRISHRHHRKVHLSRPHTIDYFKAHYASLKLEPTNRPEQHQQQQHQHVDNNIIEGVHFPEDGISRNPGDKIEAYFIVDKNEHPTTADDGVVDRHRPSSYAIDLDPMASASTIIPPTGIKSTVARSDINLDTDKRSHASSTIDDDDDNDNDDGAEENADNEDEDDDDDAAAVLDSTKLSNSGSDNSDQLTLESVQIDHRSSSNGNESPVRYSHIITSPANELPSYGRKYWHNSHKASIQLVQEEPNVLHQGGINSAIIAILFGIGATGMLVMIVSVKMRTIRERVAYRGRRRSLVPDTDFLINTIPI